MLLATFASAKQLDIIETLVAQGIAAGATVAAGGKRPGPERCALQEGHFYEPTVLVDLEPSNPAFQEEIFGPVVSVTPFKVGAGVGRVGGGPSRWVDGGTVSYWVRVRIEPCCST